MTPLASPRLDADSLHCDVLAQFARFVPSDCVLDFLSRRANSVIDCSQTPTSFLQKHLPPLASFIGDLFYRSRLSPLLLLSVDVYLMRLKQKLPVGSKGLYCTCHRTMLACLIIASKNLYDSCPKNKHWARSSGFSIVEINLMERQLLSLLDYNVTVSSAEMYAVLTDHLRSHPVLPPSPTTMSSTTTNCNCMAISYEDAKITRSKPTTTPIMQIHNSICSTTTTNTTYNNSHVISILNTPISRSTHMIDSTVLSTPEPAMTLNRSTIPKAAITLPHDFVPRHSNSNTTTLLRNTIKNSAGWSPAYSQKYTPTMMKPPVLTRTCSSTITSATNLKRHATTASLSIY